MTTARTTNPVNRLSGSNGADGHRTPMPVKKKATVDPLIRILGANAAERSGKQVLPVLTEELVNEICDCIGDWNIGIPCQLTPESLDWLLSIEVDNNRKVTRSNVEKIKRDILKGKWQLTPDSFGLTTERKLFNGKHRIYAIDLVAAMVEMQPELLKKCGKLEFPVNLMFNMAPTTLLATNTGKTAKAHEAGRAAGIEITIRQSHVARRLLTGVQHRGTFSNTEIIEAFQQYRKQILEADHLLWSQGMLHFNSTRAEDVTAILTRALINKVPFVMLEEFVEILRLGYPNRTIRQKLACQYGATSDKWKLFKDANREWSYALADKFLWHFINRKKLTDECPVRPNMLGKGNEKRINAKAKKFLGTISPIEAYVERFPIWDHEK